MAENIDRLIQQQQEFIKKKKKIIDKLIKGGCTEGDILSKCSNRIKKLRTQIEEHENNIDDRKKRLEELEKIKKKRLKQINRR